MAHLSSRGRVDLGDIVVRSADFPGAKDVVSGVSDFIDGHAQCAVKHTSRCCQTRGNYFSRVRVRNAGDEQLFNHNPRITPQAHYHCTFSTSSAHAKLNVRAARIYVCLATSN
jgi:hypothetical protein